MTQGGEVSMRDVAMRAQVSAATVSRVLNGSDTVGAAARERVRVAVAELGYRPNRLARNLRRQTAEMIGMKTKHAASETGSPIAAKPVHATSTTVA